MNTITLDKNFFTGGNATFTVDNGKGEHYTFKIKQPKDTGRFRGEPPLFISLLTGPDNTSSYSYLGMLAEVPVMEQVQVGTNSEGLPVYVSKATDKMTMDVKLTRASRMTVDSKPVKVAKWALFHAFGDKRLPEGYQIRHEGKCGCCGRKLTHPESLTRGIGPECWSKMG